MKSQPTIPTPLFKEISPSAPVPFTTLGPLRPAVEAIQTLTQAPAAIAMQSVLGMASVAVQPLANVETLNGYVPTSLFLLTVAESGERKSACDKFASTAIDTVEAPRLRSYRDKIQGYEIDQKSYKRKRRAQEKDHECEVVDIGSRISKVLKSPEKPMMPTIRISDPTFEGLVCHFEEGNPSIAIFSDEGGQFFGGHGMKHENILKTAAGLSKLWDGATIDRMRASSTPLRLMGRRASLHLMIQPGIAKSVLKDATLKDQGLLSRILVSWPESNIGYRLIEESPEVDVARALAKEEIGRFSDRIIELLETPFPSHPQDKMELVPREVDLSKGARRQLRQFFNRIEKAQRPGDAYSYMKGFASKAAEQAARISCILTIFEDRGALFVKEEAMFNAIGLMDWYLNEVKRISDTGLVSEPLQLGEDLRKWLLDRWVEPFIDVRTIIKRGPNHLRQADTAKAAIAVLMEHGWLSPSKKTEVVDENSARKSWEVIRN